MPTITPKEFCPDCDGKGCQECNGTGEVIKIDVQ